MTKPTFSLLADSISTFKGFVPVENELFYPKEGVDVTKVEHTWWHILMQRTGLELVVNESYSGSRISRTGLRPLTSCFQDEKRQARLGGDIIIVFGGTNDWGQADLPVTKEVFTQAYHQLVSSMVARHTKSSLYFCTPLQRTDRTLEETNMHGWNQLELAQIIREEVAGHPTAHLIDLALYPITCGDGMLADNLHPTRKGMEVLSILMQRGLGL
ncbi:SGNH/GDSL hydrolase family protein [Sphaerochaeta sp.]|uniref:SGNH/GDSL hydrolase family protein n=1 Tax=Sphaerochaeta sp. TaxID=1972642 RepID=UPI002FC8D05A